MQNPQGPMRRSRSAFAAAFLSFLFPGLGQAYSGALARGLAFGALPFLVLALAAGIVLRTDRYTLVGFVLQTPVLFGLLVANVLGLLYRLVAVVDAWQVARFLNVVEGSDDDRPGGTRLARGPLSLAGLLAIVLVLGTGHVALARYNLYALDLTGCVFTDTGSAKCQFPSAVSSPGASGSGVPGDAPSPSEVVPAPIGGAGAGTRSAGLPPWNGTDRLNILLVGSDQRAGDNTFNTDTMIVASVDPATNQVAMFQVPRDVVDVPVPAGARSVWGPVYRGKINSWLTQNLNRSDLWPGATPTARGFNALKAILGELYGLSIQYYVMVNFTGFTQVVDTLGGVQVNVQIPVTDNAYPGASGIERVYIPAGPQQMSGAQALVYARSRHASNDFDRGGRQQRVLVALHDQVSPQAVLANLPQLVDTLQRSIKTDVPPSMIGSLLSLSSRIDTRNIRSFVFAPPAFGTEVTNSSRGDIIEPDVARIRQAVATAFTADPKLQAQREQLAAEAAGVWVLNGSGQNGIATNIAGYLDYAGLGASAPTQKVAPLATTKVVVYNGAEARLPNTIAFLERLFKVTSVTASDPGVLVDIVVTAGRDAPGLNIAPPG
jgi:LCP family protein required for cell wall assembly